MIITSRRIGNILENKMLICFDIDGTLLTDEMNDHGEHLKGIIPTKHLINLHTQGHKIAIVSPSPSRPREFSGDEHWFKRNSSNDYRWENIKDAIIYHGGSSFDVMYVDDLIGNHKMVKKALPTVVCYTPKEFMNLTCPIDDNK